MCRYIIVTVSAKEGLLCPGFCVFNVRMVNSFLGGGISAGGVVASVPSGVWTGRRPSWGGGLVCFFGSRSAAVCAEDVDGDAVGLSCGTVKGGDPLPGELDGE